MPHPQSGRSQDLNLKMAHPVKVGCFEFEQIEPHSSDCEALAIPDPRSGHRVVVDEANLYSVGGFNPLFWDIMEDPYYPLFRELWRFNFATRRWLKEEIRGQMPHELASHSAILVGRKILVFGGTGIPFGETSSNNLYEYDLDTKEWQFIRCTGELPEKKYGHATVVHDGCLYVVGGTTGYVYNASVHILDLQSFVWRSVKTMQQTIPTGRYRHEIACDGKYIYMLGGGTSVTVFGFKKISVFDLKEEKWGIIETQQDPAHGFPSPRRCHGCMQHKDSVYIIGGIIDQTILGDLWRLCLKEYKWFKHPANMPVPAYFHSTAICKEGCIYVFGGVIFKDSERTNDLYQIRIAAPSLKELCWETICRSTKLFQKFSKKELYQLGIPLEFLNRMS